MASVMRLSAQRALVSRPPLPVLRHRTFQTQAYEASFDQDELQEARKWRAAFAESQLPLGETTYSRSSGPGGQHVNKCVESVPLCFCCWLMRVQNREQGDNKLDSFGVVTLPSCDSATGLAELKVLCEAERLDTGASTNAAKSCCEYRREQGKAGGGD